MHRLARILGSGAGACTQAPASWKQADKGVSMLPWPQAEGKPTQSQHAVPVLPTAPSAPAALRLVSVVLCCG